MSSFGTDLALTCVWVMLKKKKKLWRGVIQALSDVDSVDSLRVHVSELMACGMHSLNVYEECSRTRWLLYLFIHIKDRCGWGIFGTGFPPWDVTRSESDLLRMPLKPNTFVLHDWQTWLLQICCMTKRQPTFKTFCTCWRWTVFPLFPLFFLSFFLGLLSFYAAFTFFILLLSLSIFVCFLWRDEASFTVVSANS